MRLVPKIFLWFWLAIVAVGATLVALTEVTHSRARDDEMIEAVSFPLAASRGHGFREVARRHGDFAIVACAAVVSDKSIRFAVAGVADKPEARDWPRLLAVQQRLVVLLPQVWDELRDRGLAHLELGQTEAAIEDLSSYLEHARGATDRRVISRQLATLRGSDSRRLH